MSRKLLTIGSALVAPVCLFVTSCNKKADPPATINEVEPRAEAEPKTEPKAEPKAEPEVGSTTAIGKMLAGKAVMMDGDAYTPTEVRDAEHYLVYFTASW